ncbi:hypothetical protein C3L33_03071, partial [Rhododendron williamsianum]
MEMRLWDHCVEEELSKLESLKLIKSLKPIHLPRDERRRFVEMEQEFGLISYEFEVFDGLQEQWERASVEVEMAEGDDVDCGNLEVGNEAGACSLIRSLERFFLCKAGTLDMQAALMVISNMALMTTLGSVGSLLPTRGKPLKDDRVAKFSDALNHASIIDGIRLAERQGSVVAFVYRHCDILRCPMKKKVVVTDSLFSMDGDFAPMGELSKLQKRHGFLLVIDDAHGTFVCGKNGGGVAEELNCENYVDICVGTLSKAAGCHGGFIACSKRWKQLIQSTGRSFIFSTSTPVPIAAAAHAAVIVAQKETWRRRAIWKWVQDFHALTGIPVTSPIISLVVGSEEKALQASWYLLKSGFHVTAIRPPAVPPNSRRLRVTLSAAHTLDDLKKLTAALSECISFRDIIAHSTNGHTRL